MTEKHNSINKELKAEVIGHYGDVCASCGENEISVLTLDHIDGNGNEHRRLIGNNGGQHMYRWVRRNNFPAGFRVLCMNCNASLGMYGYCPHTMEN